MASGSGPSTNVYRSHICPHHIPPLISVGAKPPCNFFYNTTLEDSRFESADAATLQSIFDACVTGDFDGVTAETRKLQASNQPLPLQSMTLAATERGHARIVDFCFDQGAALDDSIEAAASHFPNAGLYRVLKGRSAWPQLYSLDTVLAMDVKKGHEIVELLLDYGATLNPRLVVSAASAGDVETAALLLRRGSALQDSGALQAATDQGHLKMVEWLLDHGEDIDEVAPSRSAFPDPRECRNGTALLRAVEKGHLEIVRLLLDRGADSQVRDQQGRDVLDLADGLSDEGKRNEMRSLLRSHL